MTRRLLLVASCALLVLPLACKRAETERAGPAPFKVALLTPGSIADGGWNQAAYEGLLRIRDELGAEVNHQETKTPAQFEEGFRDYASRGYRLVFGHGFEYQEAAARVASEFPHTVFITTSGNTVRENVAPMVFELEQATYLCGLLAARLSHSKILGLVGGIDLPSIRSTFVAFRGGAESVVPGISVREVFTGSFQDAGAAREAALALLEAGADALMHQANDAGRGVFQAVSERAATGQLAYAFGTNKDQNDLAPDVVLASAVLDVPTAFVQVATRVRDGTFRAEPLRLGMKDGTVSFVQNPRLADRIPAEVQAELAAVEEQIRNGSLTVPRGDF
jgi:basic membrane lipoprotein Med (substrate-binding protein (PBP1-ABC) superfamily)